MGKFNRFRNKTAGQEGPEVSISFQERNRDMEIERLRKKVRKLQKAIRCQMDIFDAIGALRWLDRHIGELMEPEP